MESAEHFADAFNYFLYDGRPVIQADQLKELDTTEIGMIGLGDSDSVTAISEKTSKTTTRKTSQKSTNGRSKESIQKYRDILKSCVIKWDRHFTYVFLGLENQSDIHYAMPVKNLVYDGLNYERQVEKIARGHRRKRDLSGDEFLSGFSKTDKLKPVITLTIYFGADDWDAPRSLFEMLEPFPPELGRYISDYKLNLLVPKEVEDFSKFSTELKQVLQFIALSEDKEALRILSTDESYEHLSVETVHLINVCTNTNIPIQEGGKEVNMCKGMQELFMEERAEGREKEIFSSVQEGDYSAARGAQKLEISVEEFERRMEAAGFSIPTLV